MLLRILVAGFLLAHAAIHFGFLSPRPNATAGGPPWPFDLGQSWLVPQARLRPHQARVLAIVLIATVVIGFALAAGVAMSILPAALWGPALALGSTASLVLLLVWFHPWLVIGIGIDFTLLALAVLMDWTPEAL